MIAVSLAEPDDFDGWRNHARALVQAGISPDQVLWNEPGGSGDLFAAVGQKPPVAPENAPPVRASKAFLDQARMAICHSDPARFAVLYRLLWRLQRNGKALEDKADPDVARLADLTRAVRRDIHKMRAFVRFRQIVEVPETADEESLEINQVRSDSPGNPSATEPLPDAAALSEIAHRYVAWFEPDHHILRTNARFFVRRFANMRWSILTPRGAMHWDGQSLVEGPPAKKEDAPEDDAVEDLWRSYYSSTFNPARLKIGAMMKEMPRKYWKNMPETALISELIAGAQARSAAMVSAGETAVEARPDSLAAAASAISQCRRCPISALGTRAVPGEGPLEAKLMIVGEQPGDQEDVKGRPFVGPAGQLLDQYLQQAGIARESAYLTNAVKHFKFEQRGKLRLHQSPSAKEIDSCRWWLESELELVQPKLILALGASAARGLLGKTVNLARMRGAAMAIEAGRELWITAHPSYLLRLGGAAREEQDQLFAQDLAAVALRLAQL